MRLMQAQYAQYLEQYAQLARQLRDAPEPQIVIVKSAKARSSAPKRLGVLSGSFNPPTNAHVELLRRAQVAYSLDECMFLLAIANVDKPIFGAPLEHRLLMMCILARGHPNWSVALSSHGRFVDKAQAIIHTYPTPFDLFFIVGYDTLVRIFDPKYYTDPNRELQMLFEHAQLIVANREPYAVKDIHSFMKHPLCAPFVKRIHILELPECFASMSSTTVREVLKSGGDIVNMVPHQIAQMIRTFNLYA